MITLAGCAMSADDVLVNPSLPISMTDAEAVLRDCTAHRKPLARPLVIIGGFLDPGFAPALVKARIQQYTGDRRIVTVTIGFCLSFDQCRQKIVDAVDRNFPPPSTTETADVDVIGISMGGLAARYAAEISPEAGKTSPRRLHIVRLFTMSSPLQGAVQADRTYLTLHPMQAKMRTGSAFINEVNRPAEPAIYAVYSYVRLRDWAVGPANAAIPGQTAWWVDPPALSSPHNGMFHDARILADIARRLRGETPLATDPPAPLPE